MTSLNLLHGLLLFLAPTTKSGFQPVNKQQLLIALYGNPCDCAGGSGRAAPTSYTRSTDCGDKIAYLVYEAALVGGYNQKWKCVTKPKIIPTVNGKPGPCPASCVMASEMHSTCYTEAQQCTYSDGKIYLTAVLQRTYRGSVGGDWDFPSPTGYSKFGQASCNGGLGKDVCWPPQAPIHISDGGGPSDQLREERVQKQLETIIQEMYPSLNYHPLVLPKPRGPDPDAQTLSVLEATYHLINTSNPAFAADCWLCLTLGTPLPLALPVVDQTNYANSSSYNCSFSLPFRVQPVQFNASVCYLNTGHNNSFDIRVGVQNFSLCSVVLNGPAAICPAPGHVLVCGGSLAFTSLPTNWTGLCVVATVLPDISLIPGDEPVPLPSFDYIAGRHKRAVSLVPLLVGLGVSGTLATGSAGVGVALHSYAKLSNQLINDVQALSNTFTDIQDQIDSLAEVVLQNRRGLDLLTAKQGGICIALNEHCCFYANKSEIVREKIHELQEDLNRQQQEFSPNPLWTGLNGFLPYLLPLLGPLLGLLLLISLGPIIYNKIMAFLRAQVETIKTAPIQVYYHRLAMADQDECQTVD